MQDFLESKGLWECEVDTIMAVMPSPNYVNVLKVASQQMLQPGMIPGMAAQGRPGAGPPAGMAPMGQVPQGWGPANVNYNY